LSKLFSSKPLIKIMRLFLLNPETSFESKDVVTRSKVTSAALRTEMKILHDIGFIKKKSFFKEKPTRSKTGKPTKKRVQGWCLDDTFPHLHPLRILLTGSDVLDKKETIKKFQKAGKIKLIVLSGIFLKEENGRIDMLIVGDDIKKKSIDNTLKGVESEVGKELSYSVMNTKEFHYRLGMCDKFVRDILDYPHEILLDRIGM
ncbi:hypothetical protein ACFL22_01260, partial [Patescibacteria group bacterium]